MRAPVSWLRELAELPPTLDPRELAERLTRAGLEVEAVEAIARDVRGPVVIGRVLSFVEETHANGKTIRWCSVDLGDDDPRGIVCGARNFAVDDHVVVALPGATLAGGFAITARRTYGHVSDGMICSARELGVGDDHVGILVVPSDHQVGDDAVEALGLGDDVLDIAVTPDRSYCLSIRGIAREAATAYGVPFRDPADVNPLPADDAGHPGGIVDSSAADCLVLATISGVDRSATTPDWMRRRLLMCGMRPLSLPIDVTNYVMLELGQPLHAYDRKRLSGTVVVRRAAPGEVLETIDHVKRKLHSQDVVIADDSGAIGLAGAMGGAATEIDDTSDELVIEAAHFDPVAIARASRRHKLITEASRRFERGADPELPLAAAARAAQLLTELAGAVATGTSVIGEPNAPSPIRLDGRRPSRTAGFPVEVGRVVQHLENVGCAVQQASEHELVVTPPSWRPDLEDPADLDEEVLRLEGYDAIPSVLPAAPAGRGFTREQRLRRRVGQALAHGGFVEAPSYPFVGLAAWEALGIDPGDPRRRALRLANALSDEEPELRTTLLPGLLTTLRRNDNRGLRDVGLFEVGLVFLPPDNRTTPPRPDVANRPTAEEIAALDAALPAQPWHVAAALAGDREPPGWWGPARPSSWADAVEAARAVGRAAGVDVTAKQSRQQPWHPGRCAQLEVDGRVLGYAGELHPRAVASFGLPARTSAMELDLSAVMLMVPEVVPAPRLSSYPLATQDVALVVDAGVAAEDVAQALRAGAGDLLESLRLFDVYRGEQLGTDRKSLAFTLRFRATDRTLTADEVSVLRHEAVAEASRRTGAMLRGG